MENMTDFTVSEEYRQQFRTEALIKLRRLTEDLTWIKDNFNSIIQLFPSQQLFSILVGISSPKLSKIKSSDWNIHMNTFNKLIRATHNALVDLANVDETGKPIEEVIKEKIND